MAWQAWFAPYTPLLHFTQVPGRERGRERSEAGPAGVAGSLMDGHTCNSAWWLSSLGPGGSLKPQDVADIGVTTLRDTVKSGHNSHQEQP